MRELEKLWVDSNAHTTHLFFFFISDQDKHHDSWWYAFLIFYFLPFLCDSCLQLCFGVHAPVHLPFLALFVIVPLLRESERQSHTCQCSLMRKPTRPWLPFHAKWWQKRHGITLSCLGKIFPPIMPQWQALIQTAHLNLPSPAAKSSCQTDFITQQCLSLFHHTGMCTVTAKRWYGNSPFSSNGRCVRWVMTLKEFSCLHLTLHIFNHKLSLSVQCSILYFRIEDYLELLS